MPRNLAESCLVSRYVGLITGQACLIALDKGLGVLSGVNTPYCGPNKRTRGQVRN